MRKFHRWTAVVAGLFILWIAATGAVTQAARLYASSEPKPAQVAPAPAAPRPPQSPTRQFIHFVTDLHSGEQFGVTGQIISLIAGLALIFFAFSGLWMYIQMYRRRGHRKSHPRKVFW